MDGKFAGENGIFSTLSVVEKLKIPKKGEIIRIGSGEVGFIDWSDSDLFEGSPGTARMMRPGQVYDIEVEKNDRDKGTGRQLMFTLIRRLEKIGYRRVVILGAIISETGFYDKILEELRQEGLVNDVSKRPRKNGKSEDVNYIVDLNDPKSTSQF